MIGPALQRFVLWALVAFAASGWIAAWWAGREVDRLVTDRAVAALTADLRYTEGKPVRRVTVPEAVELPEGAEAVAYVQGEVTFRPMPQTGRDPGPGRSPSTITLRADPPHNPPEAHPTADTAAGSGDPASSTPLVAGGASTSLVRVGRRLFARTDWWADVERTDGTVVRVERTLPLSKVEFKGWAGRPWDVTARALITSDPGLRAGVTFWPAGRRWGIPLEVDTRREDLPGGGSRRDRRVAAGIEFSLRR